MKNYGSCRCGESRWFGSMPPAPCEACEKCGTGPGGEPPEPHKPTVKMVDTDEGPKPLTRCFPCGKKIAVVDGTKVTP